MCAYEHAFIATQECEHFPLLKSVCACAGVYIGDDGYCKSLSHNAVSKNVWSGAPQIINLESVIVLSPSDADFLWQVHFKRLESCPTLSLYG